ncbi:MAG: DNA-processing protein DprA [Planctomycetota bacterium]
MENQHTLRLFLHLQRLDAIGRIRHDALAEHFGSLETALAAHPDDIAQVPGISHELASRIVARPPDHAALQAEIESLRGLGIRLVALGDTDYPENLRHCEDGPLLLQFKGTLEAQDKMALAIVGARQCSTYGREQAYLFGKALAERGFTVVSGMARGVDAAAHRGALDAGGRTLGVQACGLQGVYPPGAKDLAAAVVGSGALLSELPYGSAPLKQNFPRRNRIISGMALGTLVIEAEEKSGSLITARWAMEQNREVFAIPGRLDNPASLGCHRLIQDGAKLVTEVQDILREFPAWTTQGETATRPAVSLSGNQEKVLASMVEGRLSFNDLLEGTALDATALSLVLFQLEQRHFIKSLPQKRYQIIDAGVSAIVRKPGEMESALM